METKARYVLVGLFALFVIAGVFGFVYWLETIGGSGERVVYRIHFERTVSGLRVGSAVLFNGLRVGEVTGLALDLDNPTRITATIAIQRATPVRADTRADIDVQGLMGRPRSCCRAARPRHRDWAAARFCWRTSQRGRHDADRARSVAAHR